LGASAGPPPLAAPCHVPRHASCHTASDRPFWIEAHRTGECRRHIHCVSTVPTPAHSHGFGSAHTSHAARSTEVPSSTLRDPTLRRHTPSAQRFCAICCVRLSWPMCFQRVRPPIVLSEYTAQCSDNSAVPVRRIRSVPHSALLSAARCAHGAPLRAARS
jgi:hypothetical protein